MIRLLCLQKKKKKGRDSSGLHLHGTANWNTLLMLLVIYSLAACLTAVLFENSKKESCCEIPPLGAP